jgi:hypothetical protein
VVVFPKWGDNENSLEIDAEVFGSLVVDLYYPKSMGHTVLKSISYDEGAHRLARGLRQIVLDNIGSEACPDFELLQETRYLGKAKYTSY